MNDLMRDVGTSGITVLAEPTSRCNLECSYCYKGPKPNRTMSKEVAQRMVRDVVSFNHRARKHPTLFVWHGGEPTLMGPSFFREIFHYAESVVSGAVVRHTMQTNGTLLTDELLDVLAEFGVSISVSLDGPSEYHDRVRTARGGRSTHAVILSALERAKQKGIPVGILMSIGQGNSAFVPEMFEFCRSNGFSLGLNPLTRDFHALHADTEVSPLVYLEACKVAFDLWFFQDGEAIQVNPGHGVVTHLISRARVADCFLCENCQMSFISIGPEGDVYPCNRFYGIREFKFGNIMMEDLAVALDSPIRASLLSRSADRIDDCSICDIRQFCNGGCMHHALVHNGSMWQRDHLCVVYRGLMEHALDRLNAIFENNKSLEPQKGETNV